MVTKKLCALNENGYYLSRKSQLARIYTYTIYCELGYIHIQCTVSSMGMDQQGGYILKLYITMAQ